LPFLSQWIGIEPFIGIFRNLHMSRDVLQIEEYAEWPTEGEHFPELRYSILGSSRSRMGELEKLGEDWKSVKSGA
jgi:hypothetical protein